MRLRATTPKVHKLRLSLLKAYTLCVAPNGSATEVKTFGQLLGSLMTNPAFLRDFAETAICLKAHLRSKLFAVRSLGLSAASRESHHSTTAEAMTSAE